MWKIEMERKSRLLERRLKSQAYQTDASTRRASVSLRDRVGQAMSLLIRRSKSTRPVVANDVQPAANR
ncbi:MAG: hypothetical protein WKF81_05720 [Thermomicrobiales bacterium]